MSSINPRFTLEYSQPDAYRFSHDSVFLAWEAFQHFRDKDLKNLRGLDLCSGCGIVGLDFLYHCQKNKGEVPPLFDFVEVQEIYKVHFDRNIEHFADKPISLNFKNLNYDSLNLAEYKERYDIILSNPPYFQLGQGKLSASDFKNRCRFFMDSDFSKLITGIDNCLTPGGKALILIRDLADHGLDYYSQAAALLSKGTKIRRLSDIRGTDLVLISK